MLHMLCHKVQGSAYVYGYVGIFSFCFSSFFKSMREETESCNLNPVHLRIILVGNQLDAQFLL